MCVCVCVVCVWCVCGVCVVCVCARESACVCVCLVFALSLPVRVCGSKLTCMQNFDFTTNKQILKAP